jgi:hypothetical protein
MQKKGPMLLKVIEDGKFKDIHIGEGEMFMLPGKLRSSRACDRASLLMTLLSRT